MPYLNTMYATIMKSILPKEKEEKLIVMIIDTRIHPRAMMIKLPEVKYLKKPKLDLTICIDHT